MSMEPVKTAGTGASVTSTDILFDCPACGKSLVVDEAAEGMIVDCPQCRTNVIVPPKSVKPPAPAPRKDEPVKRDEPAADRRARSIPSVAGESPVQQRLAVLSGQLKEIQAQRTEVTGRIASRLNDVNRDLVIIARLETSQQQILAEWNQLVEKASAGQLPVESEFAQPAVIGASIPGAGRTRVAFGH
ncbi:MAG TPA: hypothetical protein VMV72_15875 [Verrucomicrobiae bacterium]|nr:hypothetical protein [Verrucomicrobiae bacterium]